MGSSLRDVRTWRIRVTWHTRRGRAMTFTIPEAHPDAERLRALLESLTAGSQRRAALTAAGLSPSALAVLCRSLPGLSVAVEQAGRDGGEARQKREAIHTGGALAPEIEAAADAQEAEIAALRKNERPDGGTPSLSDAVGVKPTVLSHPHGKDHLRDGSAASLLTSTTPPGAVNGDASGLRAMALRLEAERQAEEASAPSPRAAEHADVGGLDWDRIREEAHRLAPGPFGLFLWLEARLVAAGFPPVSPWWLATLRRFYASGKRWLVVMAGRGAGKSTMLTRVAVAEGLFTARSSPPGEAWIWPFVSASSKDARNRIRQIAAILAARGMRTDKGKPIEPSYPQGHPTIEVRDASGNPIEFVAYAGTIAALSGPTSVGATVDEEAKLRGDGSANPSGEVILTLAATFRARPGIRAIRCSSAWLTEGSHFGAISEGDTILNMVARIGDDFLPGVIDGLEAVAKWETNRGDVIAARRIREHAASLTAESVNAPTWLGNPTLGNPEGPYPWLGAAVASRIEIETLDARTFDALFPGMSRAAAWLRECASVPVQADGGMDPAAQLNGLAAWNRALAAASRGEPIGAPPVDVGPMKVRGARPGDARYAGPPVRPGGFGGGWGDGTVF